MASQQRPVVWSTKGKKLNGQKGNPSIGDGNIDIREDPGNVTIDNAPPPYGRPIDANLAIFLIRKLLESEAFQTIFFAEENNFDEETNKLIAFFRGAFDLSYGVTFDRNILLKIISQPGCEGVRSYLCLKEPVEGGDWDPSRWSIVLIGVDQWGNDLHYNDPKKEDSGEDLSTESLIAEYGHPPTLATMKQRSKSNHYKLLKYALEGVNPVKI